MPYRTNRPAIGQGVSDNANPAYTMANRLKPPTMTGGLPTRSASIPPGTDSRTYVALKARYTPEIHAGLIPACSALRIKKALLELPKEKRLMTTMNPTKRASNPWSDHVNFVLSVGDGPSAVMKSTTRA